jgi:hypothetical protein
MMLVVAMVVDTPDTTPVAVTVAIGLEALLQAPLPVAVGLVRVICAPEHTLSRPSMVPAKGNGLTVIDSVVLADPQLNVLDV